MLLEISEILLVLSKIIPEKAYVNLTGSFHTFDYVVKILLLRSTFRIN